MVHPKISEALHALNPIDFSSVPTEPEDLSNFLTTAFSYAELLINSVPPLPPTTAPPSSAIAAEATEPNTARNALDTVNPCPPPNAIDDAHAEFHKQWGKPLKLSAKENPLGVSVFKGAAHDRHGAWFARRSTHRAIGFDKFKRAIQREFIESLKSPGVGAGAIRGMGSDARIEKLEAPGLGKVEVWQLSAVFPGPVTPREFVTLFITSENALGKDSTYEGHSKPPRHYIMISRPTTHVDLPNRKDLVKGTYESVELIRELPEQSPSPEHDPELNPVEWIMITRSDPGGGIPKFMVERGTPGTIVSDTVKFLDWACQFKDLPPESDEKEVEQYNEAARRMSLEKSSPTAAHSQAANDQHGQSSPGTKTPRQQQHQGVISSIVNNVESTVESYLPKRFHMPGTWHTNEDEGPIHHHFDHLGSANEDDDDDDVDTESEDSDSDETNLSLDYFESARETRGGTYLKVAQSGIGGGSTDQILSEISTPASSIILDAAKHQHGRHSSQHERELLKLSHKRAQLDDKIAKEREAAERRAREISEKEEKEALKARERHEKQVKKKEARYQREMEKLEARREKEQRRAEEDKHRAKKREEARKKKTLQRDELRSAQTQRDQYKERLRVAERENEVLRQQLESVQRENTILVAQMGEEEVQRALDEFEGRVRDAARASSLSITSSSSPVPVPAAPRASSGSSRPHSTTSNDNNDHNNKTKA